MSDEDRTPPHADAIGVTAAVMRDVGQPLEFEPVLLDPPRTGEVLVRLTAAGVCHSDVHYWTGAIPRALPLVLGHEGTGEVVRVGDGVSSVVPGDRVVLTFLPACGRCRRCLEGRSTLCELTARLRAGTMPDGTRRLRLADGSRLDTLLYISAFAEATVVPEASVVKVPADVAPEQLCLLGCGFTTGLGTTLRALSVTPGDRVVIVGAGGVGAAALQGARLQGAQVIVVDADEHRLAAAQQLGASAGVHHQGDVEATLAALDDILGPEGADHAVESVGGGASTDTIRIAFEALRPGGTLAVVGLANASLDTLPISPLSLVTSSKRVLGVLFGDVRARADIPRYLELIRMGAVDVSSMVGSVDPFALLNTALERVARGDQSGRAVVTFDA